MKVFGLAILFAASVASEHTIEEFISWSKYHGKEYESDIEHRMRFGIWKANHEMIDQHNSGDHSYKTAMNMYGDLTHHEFLKRNGYAGQSYVRNPSMPMYQKTFPELKAKVDWREHGLVAEVKNQGQCGSCYSFSATGALEGQWRKHTGKDISFSEQQIVDCSKKEGNLGCQGGLMDSVFQYIKDEGGDETEKDYPYHASVGKCKASHKKEVPLKMKGWVDIPSGDEEALTEAIATQGPISVAIDASHFTFQFYHSGVYDPWFCSSTALDHGVLAVGYGTYKENGKDYYIVKNSWGSGWGVDNGYILMVRGNKNKCGIATQASYPQLQWNNTRF